MTPTQDSPTFTFRELTMVPKLAGSTTLVNTCHLLAPSVCKSLIFSISVAINPLSTSKMLTMREIASVMMMMALGPAPTQTIKIGPRATLGRAFKMTRYGSDTRERNFDHQSRLAISVPATVPSRKPTTVSKQDMPICGKEAPLGI